MALGYRGDLWVVGAQNAGKSSLISAMKRLAGTAGKGEAGAGGLDRAVCPAASLHSVVGAQQYTMPACALPMQC